MYIAPRVHFKSHQYSIMKSALILYISRISRMFCISLSCPSTHRFLVQNLTFQVFSQYPVPYCVQFVERRILFGNVPLNMTTTRTAVLHNSGHNHAMFYVINSNPFPGMSVTPVHGVVPVGGNTELKVSVFKLVERLKLSRSKSQNSSRLLDLSGSRTRGSEMNPFLVAG